VNSLKSGVSSPNGAVIEESSLRLERKQILLPILGFVALCAIGLGVAAITHKTAVVGYGAYIGISLILAAIAYSTLYWMMNAWRTPDALDEDRPTAEGLPPSHSFSIIVPARHEETVLEETLHRLLESDHPAFEVLVVVGADDLTTRAVADRVAASNPDVVQVVLDQSWPKSKPKALNAALPRCAGAITGVFDAEDDVHPELLRRVDEYFQLTGVSIVQAGVQLMDLHSSWWAVQNVLEYYFWFRSRLHLHARQRFVPLGGNTIFIRTDVLRAANGWDPDCLAEDCELGVRLSALGHRAVVFYEPDLVTREECPPSLPAFVRQRTRWNQGYLQTLLRGFWRLLPIRERALGFYILATPFILALAWLLVPVAILTAIVVKAPVPITLASFLPIVPILSMLAVEIVALAEFSSIYKEKLTVHDYLRLIVGLPFYQALLAFAAARAVVRELRGQRGWEKTVHFGLHLARVRAALSSDDLADLPSNQPEPEPVLE